MLNSTLKTIINAFNTAGEDPARFAMCKVGIKALDKETLVIFSTNGHMLSEVTIKDEYVAAELEQPQYIDRERLPVLKLLLKEFKNSPIPQNFKEGLLELFSNSLTVSFETERTGNFTYPNISMVKPKVDESFLEVSFNAQYIMDIAKAIQGEASRTHSVRLRINPNKEAAKFNPIEVTNNSGGYAVLMPVRM